MINATLVTIHGFWSSPATWEQLDTIWSVDEQLRGLRIHPFGYQSPKRPRLPLSPTRIPDYEDIAQALAVEYTVALANEANIAVVTHSQGGLILQRFLTWMLDQGRGAELARIKTITMLACPNDGSEYLRSIRQILGYSHHPQAGNLTVLKRQVADTERAVIQRIVNATDVSEHHCHIPIHVYAGGSDGIVTAASAQGAFPGASVLPGDHFSILDPAYPGNRTAEVVKHHLLRDMPNSTAQSSRHTPEGSDASSGPAKVAVATEAAVVPRTPLIGTADTAPEESARDPRQHPEDQTSLSDLSAITHDLIHDVDMLADSQSEAEGLARSVAELYADAELSDLLRAVATALSNDTGQLIWRRLAWFGRQLLRSAGARLAGWSLEQSIKAVPLGMAVLLTDPTMWGGCSAEARRRCLTALLGSPDTLNAPTPLSVQLLAPLLRTGVLIDDEAARVQANFKLASLEFLINNGMTLDMLAPRILTELSSGDFARQNPAAWFLCNLSPAVRDQSLGQELDFSLGATLTNAASGTYPSYGARDAMAWAYVSTWPSDRIAGGIWAAVSQFDGQYLRAPTSGHLSNLVAAAHGKGLLREIIEFVRGRLDQSLQWVPGDLPRASDDVLRLANQYSGSDQRHLISFGDWLRTRYVGE